MQNPHVSVDQHYLNQCCNIVNWTLRKEFQWNFNWNSNIFIEENTLKCCPFSSRSQCENSLGFTLYELTRWGRAMHKCVFELGQHWFRWWFVSCLAPSHYLNQYWLLVNFTLRSKLMCYDISQHLQYLPMAYKHMVVIILSKIHYNPSYSIPIIIVDCITYT